MLSADEIINLKAKVATELARRNFNGSLVQYVSSDYDFEHVPEKDKPLYVEQGQKFMEQLLQVQDIGDLNFKDIKTDDVVPESLNFNEINNTISKWEQETETQSSSSCRGACSGLCYGACSSGCSGCTSSCGGSCEGSCYSSCGTSCGNSCGASCSSCRSSRQQ